MQDIRSTVRNKYGAIAKLKSSCCGSGGSCGTPETKTEKLSAGKGYSDAELQIVPDDADLGLGCGNPTALATLKPGEVVLDLGSGGGIDCFLAAEKVGPQGRVIGVDMTPEMISLARLNAAKVKAANVEFRLGEIENLPVADSAADVIISNCVINLSTDKKRVFQEAYRVLRPGGRAMISDIVLLEQIPEEVKESINAYVGCVAGALLKDDYLEIFASAGFDDITVVDEQPFGIIGNDDPYVKSLVDEFNLSPEQIKSISESIVSIKVKGNAGTYK